MFLAKKAKGYDVKLMDIQDLIIGVHMDLLCKTMSSDIR